MVFITTHRQTAGILPPAQKCGHTTSLYLHYRTKLIFFTLILFLAFNLSLILSEKSRLVVLRASLPPFPQQCPCLPLHNYPVNHLLPELFHKVVNQA